MPKTQQPTFDRSIRKAVNVVKDTNTIRAGEPDPARAQQQVDARKRVAYGDKRADGGKAKPKGYAAGGMVGRPTTVPGLSSGISPQTQAAMLARMQAQAAGRDPRRMFQSYQAGQGTPPGLTAAPAPAPAPAPAGMRRPLGQVPLMGGTAPAAAGARGARAGVNPVNVPGMTVPGMGVPVKMYGDGGKIVKTGTMPSVRDSKPR